MNKTVLLLMAFMIVVCDKLEAQSNLNKDIRLGAYYFDGWTGKSAAHLNPQLTDDFPDRKPTYGWLTSTTPTVEKQIDYAANSGINYFNFCWYYNNKLTDSLDDDPKNNALKLYLKAKNKRRLSFSILVANHSGYEFKSDDWDQLITYWCRLFKDSQYVKVNNKPLITFFDMNNLIKAFGSEGIVQDAFLRFKNRAKEMGLHGVTIAACINSKPASLRKAKNCGFDVVTSYNNHDDNFTQENSEVKSVSVMQTNENLSWDVISEGLDLPQIPTITLNWDPRPVARGQKSTVNRLTGFSGKSVKTSVIAVRKWIKKNPTKVTQEKLVNIYAWNEYGEGAWLTPTRALKDSLIDGLKQALSTKVVN